VNAQIKSQATHTAGPWHTGGIFEPDSDRPSANVWGPTFPGMQSGNIVCCNATVADARLIAAAPDMAEALRDALVQLECSPMISGYLAVVTRARAALAKAGL
jgi:hypothetical protein